MKSSTIHIDEAFLTEGRLRHRSAGNTARLGTWLTSFCPAMRRPRSGKRIRRNFAPTRSAAGGRDAGRADDRYRQYRFLRYVVKSTPVTSSAPPSTEERLDLAACCSSCSPSASPTRISTAWLCLCDHSLQFRQSCARHLLLLAYRYRADFGTNVKAWWSGAAGARTSPCLPIHSGSSASKTIPPCSTRSATTSSPPTARRCSAPTTRPGLAEIVTAAGSGRRSGHPPRNDQILFTPDEEVGRDLRQGRPQAGADFAYTLNGRTTAASKTRRSRRTG